MTVTVAHQSCERKMENDNPVENQSVAVGEVISKKKNKGGRPKGSKDSVKRVRSPSLKTLEKVNPEGQTKALALFTAKFVESGKLNALMEKWIEVAFDDNHKLQGHAWDILAKRGLPMSYFDKGGGGTPKIEINVMGTVDISER